MDIETSDLTLQTGHGTTAAYLAAPGPGATEIQGSPAVLVLHAWWGLNDDFRGWCDELAAAGFTALAPDLRGGRVVDTQQAAQAMMADVRPDTVRPVLESARAELLRRTGAASYGIVAASMGAGWAFELAETEPAEVSAVVAYYGVADADWSRVTARVLHHFGERDCMDPVTEAEAMQQAMLAGGVDATLELYPGADHWFAEPSRPESHAEHAALAWRRTLATLGRT